MIKSFNHPQGARDTVQLALIKISFEDVYGDDYDDEYISPKYSVSQTPHQSSER